MTRLLRLLVLMFSFPVLCISQTKSPAPRYGSNSVAGHWFTHDGVKLYYEVYGTGKPLLLIHGNGGSISDLRRQIEFFRKKYQVIVMDNRDQGKSGDSADKLTYEKMAADQAALLEHLKAKPAYVLGWSDGAIEALILGMKYPDRVEKIAAMAANLNPTDQALDPDVLKLIKDWMAAVPPEKRGTAEGKRELKVTGMMLEEPNIPTDALETIKAPTLVLAADHDMIRDEHTLDVYHHIPNSELAIFPGATHMIPYDDPAAFNATVAKFFAKPFVKIERINDTVKSLDKLRSNQD